MEFELENDLYELLVNQVLDASQYIFTISKVDKVRFSIKMKDIREVMLLINDEIVFRGLDNQDTVNEFGIQLYRLYDELFYQIETQ